MNNLYRFEFVPHDTEAAAKHQALKNLFQSVEKVLEHLKPGRCKSLALTSLEESFMWCGKALRDEQIEREHIHSHGFFPDGDLTEHAPPVGPIFTDGSVEEPSDEEIKRMHPIDFDALMARRNAEIRNAYREPPGYVPPKGHPVAPWSEKKPRKN